MSENKQTLPIGMQIAVIGMAGRFPGAQTIRDFWNNLCNGVESITLFSKEELSPWRMQPDLIDQPNFVPAKGVIQEPEYFDARFFGYSRREAEIMDPQIRLFHECVWEALEDAGYNPEGKNGPVGIFAGASPNVYWQGLSLLSRNDSSGEQFAALSFADKDFLSTNVSYKLNLNGPSVTVNSACSTSLVAIHQASRALLTGECTMAVAGGVSVPVPNPQGYLYQEGMILSPDGHCRTFDANAAGTVPGEGIGVVVLKSLKRALADGDHIYAVIRGSAINNDGNRKIGFTAPSIDGQADVIRAAQRMSMVEPESISYVEAHGTATTLGDPIEIEALKAAFRTDQRGYCHIGSVKSNIGHLDAAAGVAGFIKTVLALHHRQIPPTLHFEKPNPRIDFAHSPFVVTTELTPWHREDSPLRAGVSSFGIGGTNAHVILEQAPAPATPAPSHRDWHLLPLSARSTSALEQMAHRLGQALQAQPELSLADVASTLQLGRAQFAHRRVLLCASLDQAIAQLIHPSSDPRTQGVAAQQARPLFWLFPGQGAQYVNMARQLSEHEPVFREMLDHCLTLAQAAGAGDLRALLYPASPDEESDERLAQTEVAQPVLFSVEYALAHLLGQWGLRPQGMLGHSIGEYVAACLAGVFSLDDAIHLVVKRGLLMSQAPHGVMVSVELSEEEIQPYLHADLSLAAVNTPQQCVVSGSLPTITALEQTLQHEGRRVRRLSTSHAFHSSLMDPILDAFETEVKGITLHAPKLPFLSNLTGTWMRAEDATDASYWVRHLRQPVRFAQGMSQLLSDPDAILLEVGPGNTLSTFARQAENASRTQEVLHLIRHRREERSDEAHLLGQLGRFWVGGGTIDWAACWQGEKRQRLSLPTYPFQRQRFWLEENILGKDLGLVTEKKPRNQKNENIAEWFYLPSWQRSMMPTSNGTQPPSCWLLFQDKLGLGVQITEFLMDKGLDVIRVDIGSQYKQINAGYYTINPSSAHDYSRLLKALSDAGKKPEAILHMWSVSPPSTPQNFAEAQTPGYYSLIYLAQAIGAQKNYAHINISVITTNVVEVTGSETLSPENATILGPCKVIPQEYSNIRCKNIDVDITGNQNTGLVAKKIIEECVNWTPDPIVAYRGSHRWIQEMSPIHLETGSTTLFQDDGVYLIIGGLGGIGLILANYLAKHHRARLILVGKSWFPSRNEWAAWSEKKGVDDRIVRRIHAIKQLEEYGSEVLALQADISCEADMQRVIDDIEHRYGKLNGVIHSAGLPGGDSFRAIQQINHETDEEQFVAKVHGVNMLQKVLRGKHIDFCLLFSSIASILGGLGFCAYTAANQYLDTFVQKQNQQDEIPWLCINWDAWGFSDSSDMPSSVGETIIAAAIVPDKEGEDVFQHIALSGFRNQLLVSTFDLQERIKTWVYLDSTRNRKENQGAAPFARPALSNPYIEPANDMEKKLVELWKTFFRIEQVGIHDNFFELGASSLDAIQITHFIKEKLELNIPIVSIFTYPTIALLSNHLTTEAELITEEVVKPEERVEERQRIQMRRMRRMQEED